MISKEELSAILADSFEKNFSIKEVKPYTYQVFLPYFHEDGDMIDIFVQIIGNQYVITDLGKTMMRLSYYTELDSATRKKTFDTILASYFVEYSNGKLIVRIEDTTNIFGGIMELLTVITKVTDISYLKQERVRSLFYEYFDTFILNKIGENLGVNIKKDFYPAFDEKKEYQAPYAIVDTKIDMPLLIFPVLNDDRCKDSIMTLLYYKTQGYENKSLVVFNEFNTINTKDAGKLMDLADRPLSNFEGNKEKIIEYSKELIVNN